jgi:hypothetical protein
LSAEKTLDALFAAADARQARVPQIARIRLIWRNLRGGGGYMLSGCGCGLPAMHVSPADFERELVEHLQSLTEWKAAVSVSGIEELLDALDHESVLESARPEVLRRLEKALSAYGLHSKRSMVTMEGRSIV